MVKFKIAVYTCDVCGRQFMRRIGDLDTMPPGWENVTSPYRSFYLMCTDCSAEAKRLFNNMLKERKGTGLLHSKTEEVQE